MHDDAHAAGVARAGAEFAARRAELNITVQDVVNSKILSRPGLANFEKGQSWPRESTRAKLEQLAELPPGALTNIYNEASGLNMEDEEAGAARAGAAFRVRRKELGIPVRAVADQKILSAPSLIAFEKGRSWPRDQNRARLEQLVNWPPGTLARLQSEPVAPSGAPPGSAVPSPDTSAMMIEAVKIALSSVNDKLKQLPSDQSDAFVVEAAPLLATLRSLQALASRAVRANVGSADAVRTLEEITGCFQDLVARVGQHPAASVGQRLYVARTRGHLSAQDVAAILDLPAAIVTAIESDTQELTDDYRERIEQLIRTLSVLKR